MDEIPSWGNEPFVPEPWGGDVEAEEPSEPTEPEPPELDESWGEAAGLIIPEAPEGFRAGYVAVIGRPNVGKSSLVNALLGERLAPTSPVPQTTRRRLLGILTLPMSQIVFVDTPGLHEAKLALSKMMVHDAEASLVDADVVLMVVDSTREPGAEDQLAYERAKMAEVPRLLVVNKVDLVGREDAIVDHRQAHRAAFELDTTFETSAVRRDGLDDLLAAVIDRLPESPPYFPADQVSDAMEREIAADLIREAALRKLSEELPHAVAVKVNEWKERENGMVYVHAHLFVERDSQKGIVIGRGGKMLRAIGSIARQSLERWLDQRVYLELEVKVLKGWRKDPRMRRYLGFQG